MCTMHTFHRQQIATDRVVSNVCRLVSAEDRSDQTSSDGHIPGMSAMFIACYKQLHSISKIPLEVEKLSDAT